MVETKSPEVLKKSQGLSGFSTLQLIEKIVYQSMDGYTIEALLCPAGRGLLPSGSLPAFYIFFFRIIFSVVVVII